MNSSSTNPNLGLFSNKDKFSRIGKKEAIHYGDVLLEEQKDESEWIASFLPIP